MKPKTLNAEPIFGAANASYWAALIDDLKSLISDLERQRRAVVLEEALRTYYAAEELARDPANAYLIEPLEEMRAVYERTFGRPIPPKGTR